MARPSCQIKSELLHIIATLIFLAFLKKDNDNPLADIVSGISSFCILCFYLIMYGVGMLLSIGGVYWLWMAIQLKSFLMFFVGLLPIAWIFTAPVGAYLLIMQTTPQWITEWFN